MVPAPTSCPMPDKQRSSERRDRLYLLYLQPWVLEASWAIPGIVPHISRLNEVEEPSGAEIARLYSYSAAWKKYISHNVVSRHAHRIIVQFMGACCGKSKTVDAQADSAAAGNQRTCPANDMLLTQVHALIDGVGAQKAKVMKTKAMGQVAEQEGVAQEDDNGPQQLSLQMANALRTVDDLWRRDASTWTATAENMVNSRLGISQDKKSSGTSTRRQKQEEPESAQCSAYIALTKTNVTTWWRHIRNSKTPPTGEQTRFLEYAIARCQTEHDELMNWHAPKRKHGIKDLTEPSRCALLGIPGAGKSLCLSLLRDFFENVLGWRHGVQFQFLSAQNSMAALIGGNTVHSWGVIPTSKTAASAKYANKEVDWDQLFENCISMRWLVIDEVSTIPLGLLGTLESFLRTKACTRHPYAYRDAHRRGQARMFGGLNLCLSGDLWQLGPVRDLPIFSHPMKKSDGTRYEAGEQRMLAMFWDCHKAGFANGIQRLFELTQPKRSTTDQWLQMMLEQCRSGCQSWEVYCFVHGLPTRNPGTWLPNVAAPTCGDSLCATLAHRWELLWKKYRTPWSERQSMECEVCRAERNRRCCIIARPGHEKSEAHLHDVFAEAPLVHPFRSPTNHAQRLRALRFAREKQTRLLWIVAYDRVVSKDKLSKNQQSREAAETWLTLDDRKTGGIAGFFPAVLDLPVRFTCEPTHGDRLKGLGHL